MKNRIFFLFFLLHAVTAFSGELIAPAPDFMVKQVVGEVLSTLQQDSGITHDIKKLDALVDAKIFPRFDFSRMTRLTIGAKYWNSVTPQVQQQMVDEFRIFLGYTFADAIAQYTDETVDFVPLYLDPEANDLTVKTRIMDPKDEPTKLYFQVEKTTSEWKIYDLKIDGVSLVRLYHANFSSDLRQEGVEGLIRKLHKKNQEVAASRHG